MSVCAYVHSVWACSFFFSFSFPFWDKVSLRTWRSPIGYTGCQQATAILLSPPFSTRITTLCHHPQSFTWVPEIWTQVMTWVSLSIEPSPQMLMFVFFKSSSFIYYIQTAISLAPRLLVPPLPPISSRDPLFLCFLQKRTGISGVSTEHTKQVTIRLVTNPHIKARWGNIAGRKAFQKKMKESEITPNPTLRSPTKIPRNT